MIKLEAKTLYFGSSNPNIKEISKGKFLTTFKSIACCFAIDLNDVYQENKKYYSINWGYDQWSKSEKYLNKQLIPNLIKITNNAADWIPTSGKSIGYLYAIKVDEYLLNHIETFNNSDPKWEVIYNGELDLPVTLIEELELNWTCEYSKQKSDNCGFAIEKPIYERPWTYNEVKQHYGKYIADKLYKDPVHKWRMETGIELIHKEPDLAEQKRIWKNWQLMPDEYKQISDEKCIEFTGMTNDKLHKFIMKNNWNNPKHLKSKFYKIYEQVMIECDRYWYLLEALKENNQQN